MVAQGGDCMGVGESVADTANNAGGGDDDGNGGGVGPGARGDALGEGCLQSGGRNDVKIG